MPVRRLPRCWRASTLWHMPFATPEYPMPSLQLFLFGAPRLELNTVVALRRSKALALLAYLAVRGQPSSATRCLHCCGRSLMSPARAITCVASCRCSKPRWAGRCWSRIGCRWRGAPRRTSGLILPNGRRCLTLSDNTRTRRASCVPRVLTPSRRRCGCRPMISWPASAWRKARRFDEWQFFQREELRRRLGASLQSLIAWHARRPKLRRGAGLRAALAAA